MNSVAIPDAGAKEAGAPVPRVPPPLYFGVTFGVGMAVQASNSLGLHVPAAAGAAVLLAGISLTALAVVSVARAGTTIVPHHAVAVLLTTGAFRVSRNPMYAGIAIAYVGGALLAGSWWPLILLPLPLAAIHFLVIAREERYLTEKFPAPYAAYRSRTRRWL